MAKLWDKGYEVDALLERFTVADDWLVDMNLVTADCLASIAHARTLQRAALLSIPELETLEAGLCSIIDLDAAGAFPITVQDEDCHTAIETYLTREQGEVGKKIHTGRSRNDQVLTALRLWMREFAVVMAGRTTELAKALTAFAKHHEWLPMPGRTHMQLAMPSSVGLWAAAFAEALLDQADLMRHLAGMLDQSPLGSAASYGTPLALDRAFSARQMGFAKVQNNVLYANNSRGLFEAMLLDGCDYITLSLSKLAQDLMVFTLPELGYFTLPKELCTGSSIMPQKRNPDGLELTRSRSAVVSSCAERVKSIIRSLPSGYNRDFQDTKEPLFKGCRTALEVVQIMHLMITKLEVHPEALLKGCRSELYATDEVLLRLARGGSFRDVYKEVGQDLQSLTAFDPLQTIKNRTSAGTSGALGLDGIMQRAGALADECELRYGDMQAAYRLLSGREVRLVRW